MHEPRTHMCWAIERQTNRMLAEGELYLDVLCECAANVLTKRMGIDWMRLRWKQPPVWMHSVQQAMQRPVAYQTRIKRGAVMTRPKQSVGAFSICQRNSITHFIDSCGVAKQENSYIWIGPLVVAVKSNCFCRLAFRLIDISIVEDIFWQFRLFIATITIRNKQWIRLFQSTNNYNWNIIKQK